MVCRLRISFPYFLYYVPGNSFPYKKRSVTVVTTAEAVNEIYFAVAYHRYIRLGMVLSDKRFQF